MDRLPLIAPRPPRLSGMSDALRAIEERGIYSNGGPVVRGFEAALTDRVFGGAGDCLAVGNATLGLMLAIRHAAGPRAHTGAFALMPSFTFAATAHAAEWAGLTPLICDIDPNDWAASAAAEAAAFAQHGDRIAAVVPYATFGASIDLARYRRYAERGVGVVVDAAASLGAIDADGSAFGAGAPFAIVYSMHATKVFATAEGGVVHSGDAELIAALRRMTNFGFAGGRSAEGPGFNAKLPEVLGLLAAAKLDELDAVADHRATLDPRLSRPGSAGSRRRTGSSSRRRPGGGRRCSSSRCCCRAPSPGIARRSWPRSPRRGSARGSISARISPSSRGSARMR